MIDSAESTRLLGELNCAHASLLEAGRAFVAGDLERAADALGDVRGVVADVEADLRRHAVEQEPR